MMVVATPALWMAITIPSYGCTRVALNRNHPHLDSHAHPEGDKVIPSAARSPAPRIWRGPCGYRRYCREVGHARQTYHAERKPSRKQGSAHARP